MIPREVMSLISRRRIVAEVRTETAMQALSVVDALAAGGVITIEVSLTIPGAQEILTHLTTRQDVLVGAGAVLDGKQAREAIAAGARFIASPVFNPELALISQDANIACVLGALTPSEIIAAQRAGAEMVKLFPAEALGGPMYVRALLRQLTHMSLQISGGFSAEHMIEYLELPIRSLALGTLLVPRVLVERGHWQAITNRARAFVDYAANPHAYAAQFLAMMGIGAPQAAPASPVNPRIANIPTMPVPPGMIDPTVPDMPVRSGHDPAASSSGFHPWDSRPVELGDDEDWLR
ncbi:MAG TPA: bifunctional 4-hydroxy-2-oxoglutarate aldolase/2-dehydro-3-deoxy-phosphogluconate aldolase [Ktedonobacterales bacterium]|nr:bifunctional 4-hydroxy-2-oxoglutarate aldolase/2-dehydro-3-deoxy-phosphogluconate aldolase [Ktedonobacterales bacterium]